MSIVGIVADSNEAGNRAEIALKLTEAVYRRTELETLKDRQVYIFFQGKIYYLQLLLLFWKSLINNHCWSSTKDVQKGVGYNKI